jgi:HlyD family secretion protein
VKARPPRCTLTLLLLLLYVGMNVGDAAPQTGDEFVRSVRTVRAETGALTLTRSATATIEPARESRVSAATTGQVARIVAREGSRVEAGEVIVYLEDDALQLARDNAALAVESARINLQSAERASASGDAQAQAALQAARASLELAQEAYEAGVALFEAGGLARSELTQLRVQLEQAEASYLQAEGAAEASRLAPSEELALLRLQLEQAQTQLQQAEAALRDAELRAPFAGEIAEMLVEEGEFIGAGSPAFRVVATEGRLARFDVPPEDAPQLLEAGLIWLPYGGLDYAARPLRTSQTQGGRLVTLVAEIYPSERPIPTGTVTQFSYELTLAEGTLLPSAALRPSGGEVQVLVVEGGVVQARTVQVVGEAGAQVAVTGLPPGSEVVFPVPADLPPGTPVQVLEEEAP